MNKKFTIAGWVLALLAGAAQADVQEKLSYNMYGFSARDGDNLGRVISDAFPVASERSSHGHTRWNIRWNARWSPDGKGCRVTSSTVTLDMTMTLPRMDAGTPQQRRAFDSYLPRLREHEMGHVAANRANARAADAWLRSLRIAGSCGAMLEEARAGFQTFIDRNREQNREYDAETDHGRTQGARIASRY